MECHSAISLGRPPNPQKGLMFMKTQRSVERSIYFLDNSAESILALLLCASHSTTIHLCATGFIFTLQTFIKANLTGAKKRGDRVYKNSYKNAAAAQGRFCLNKKRSILK